MASAQETTGGMIGIVRDYQGAAFPSVTLCLSSPSLIGTKKVTTGPDGRFSFTHLAPGVYYVHFVPSNPRESSFEPRGLKVEIALNRTATVLPKLKLRSKPEVPPDPQVTFKDSITVTADVTQTGINTVFPGEYLDRTSTGSQARTYQLAIGRAPGVDSSTSEPRAFGSIISENSYFIDGIDTTDPLTGTVGVNFPFDAIKEISVQTGFAAEYGRATGAVINIVTKSGGEEFSGTLDARYSDNQFNENGTHFNRDTNKTEFLKPSATLGGPVLPGKIWFFTAFESIDSKSTPTGSALTSDLRGTDSLLKGTFQMTPNWSGVAKYSSAPIHVDNFNAGLGVEPAAAEEQRQGNSIYQAEVAWDDPSTKLHFQLQGGTESSFLDRLPQTGNLEIPAIVDLLTGIFSNNYFDSQSSRRNRDELQASLTDSVDQALGSHVFKLGVSQSQTRLLAKNNLTGGSFYQDFNGPINPNAFLLLQEPLDFARFTGVLDSAFLQDAWQPSERITLQLGLRYDQIKFKNDAGVQVSDQHSLQPRLGFAINLTGDAKTALRGSYGLYMSPNSLALPLLTRTNNAPLLLYAPCSAHFSSAAECAALGPFGPAGYLQNDPLRRDPLGYFKVNEVNTNPTIIQPGLKPMTTTEYTVALERRISDQTIMELSYIHKRTHDIFEDTCAENVPNPTADPDESNCPTFEVANLPAAKRDYQGVLLTLDNHLSEHFQVKASYVYSKSRGSIEYTQDAGPDFDFFPTLFVNRYGYLSDDRRHRVRLDGFVHLPFGWNLAIQSDYSSSFPYSKVTPALTDVEYLAPRSAFRANSTFNISLEARKGFPIGPLHGEVIGSILNLLGTEQVTSVCENALGCGGAIAWGGATGYTQPRHYEVGLRLVF
jgi:outer membrane receptor protein involved in Fe transport